MTKDTVGYLVGSLAEGSSINRGATRCEITAASARDSTGHPHCQERRSRMTIIAKALPAAHQAATVLPGREADDPAEVAVQVALIREPGLDGRFT